ncbi:hypothetical protein [Acetobacter pasteurianus]|uniref:Uncharacterized protein n=1 Tax=Acetobacter pasteurianus subsp. pasteurianus TaxID=481145 RepID=A0AAC9SLH0_ACEPA|nr:hypothetical protein [Acetobacter pasteurianus]ASC05008.1 hypothetical protein S101468_00741 [Acetobacter pasteurianus subsp. pasteurianus]
MENEKLDILSSIRKLQIANSDRIKEILSRIDSIEAQVNCIQYILYMIFPRFPHECGKEAKSILEYLCKTSANDSEKSSKYKAIIPKIAELWIKRFAEMTPQSPTASETPNIEIADKITVLEQTVERLREIVNSISNDKVPRISMRRLNKALGEHSILTTSISEKIDDDEISDIEAAIYDAQTFSERANQDTRRTKSAMEVHRVILAKLLKNLQPSDVSNILEETKAYASNFPEDPINPDKIRAGSRQQVAGIGLDGLELRAFNKELDAITSLLKS